MSGEPIFEEAIASIIRLEMIYINKTACYPFETSASKRFIARLVSIAQNTPASD